MCQSASDDVMAVEAHLNDVQMDVQMLECARTPVLMGRALETRGWAVTALHDESGVALAIETFCFGRAS
jgi:hydroxymethylpyrimidine pyrophosphatase-like HAD family hydrolase